VHIVKSTEKIGGIGELGVPALAPAVASAVFDATVARAASTTDLRQCRRLSRKKVHRLRQRIRPQESFVNSVPWGIGMLVIPMPRYFWATWN
jgi:hypothetical protein